MYIKLEWSTFCVDSLGRVCGAAPEENNSYNRVTWTLEASEPQCRWSYTINYQ